MLISLYILIYLIISRLSVSLWFAIIEGVSLESWTNGTVELTSRGKGPPVSVWALSPITGDLVFIFVFFAMLFYPFYKSGIWLIKNREENRKKLLAKEKIEEKKKELARINEEIIEKELDKEISISRVKLLNA